MTCLHITQARSALLEIWPAGAQCEHTKAREAFIALDAADQRNSDLVQALEAMCGQYLSVRNGKLQHDCMSAGELAFDVLGWPDSGKVLDPEQLCEVAGCGEAWSCGVFGKDEKYHTFCGKHHSEWHHAGNGETQEQGDARWHAGLIKGGMTEEDAQAHMAKIRSMHTQWLALREKMPEAHPLELLNKFVENEQPASPGEKLMALANQVVQLDKLNETSPSSAAQEFTS